MSEVFIPQLEDVRNDIILLSLNFSKICVAVLFSNLHFALISKILILYMSSGSFSFIATFLISFF